MVYDLVSLKTEFGCLYSESCPQDLHADHHAAPLETEAPKDSTESGASGGSTFTFAGGKNDVGSAHVPTLNPFITSRGDVQTLDTADVETLESQVTPGFGDDP